MKYLFIFIVVFLSSKSYGLTVEDILKTYDKNKVISVLNQQFQDLDNTKLTIEFNGVIKQLHRPAQEYITPKTIKIDLKRLGIQVNHFNTLIIKDIEDRNRKKLRKIEESKKLKIKQAKEIKELHLFGFEFDGWQSGLSISEMKQQAMKRQLTMSPGRSTYISSYNERLLNSQPTQRNYTYRTNLMGKMTTIILSFTKSTKKLFQIKATFHISQMKPEERKYFYDSLYSQLTKKYGNSSNIQKKDIGNIFTRVLLKPMIGSLILWKPNKKNKVTLSYKKQYHLMNSYELTYINEPLTTTNKNEITLELQQRTNDAISTDSTRF